MGTINQQNALNSLTLSDLVAIWSSPNQATRYASLTALLSLFQANLTSTDDKITQYAAPNATGFTVNIGGSQQSIYLLLTPLAGYATGTVVLPASPLDKQELLVTTTQAVTTLTISLNGAAAVNGAPTTLAANAFFTLRFDGVYNSWYRVG